MANWWRTGTKNQHTIYRDDIPIGCAFTPDDARELVQAANFAGSRPTWEYTCFDIKEVSPIAFASYLRTAGTAGWELCGFAHDIAWLKRRT